MTERTVLFAGGGTAGHVFPAVAVARALVEADSGLRPVFVGTSGRLEGRLVPAAGFDLHHIDVLPIPRKLSPAILRVPGALRRSVADCARLIGETAAVASVTFGGYVSFPLARATYRSHLPLVLHEQNSIPGLANRFASRWADRVAVTFPGSADRFPYPERVAVTGNPVRREILELDAERARARSREHFRLVGDRTTVLVFGGSQGAQSLNRAAIASYRVWRDPDRLQILHSAGRALYAEAAAGWEQARNEAREGPLVRCVDFIDDMAAAYAAADVVVCRAGATSIAELTVLGKPAVLVPYPHATADHQRHNASALERAGGAAVILDHDLDARSLAAAVEPLREPEAHARMAAASRAFGRRDAADNVVRLVLDLVAAERPVDPTLGGSRE